MGMLLTRQEPQPEIITTMQDIAKSYGCDELDEKTLQSQLDEMYERAMQQIPETPQNPCHAQLLTVAGCMRVHPGEPMQCLDAMRYYEQCVQQVIAQRIADKAKAAKGNDKTQPALMPPSCNDFNLMHVKAEQKESKPLA